MVNGDVAMLDRLLAVELSYINNRARIEDKHAFLYGIKSGKTKYTSIIPSERQVHVMGTVATVIGVAVIRGEEEPGAISGFGTPVCMCCETAAGRWSRGSPPESLRTKRSTLAEADESIQSFFTLILSIGLVTLTAQSPARQPYTTWSDYGGSADSMQYSALKQITKSNVAQLQRAWFYPVPDRRGSFSFNPLIVDDVMYVLGQKNSITALDAATGTVIWTHVPEGGSPGARGINYWESNDRSDRRLIFGVGGHAARDRRAHGQRDYQLRRQRPRQHACRRFASARRAERHRQGACSRTCF